MPAVPNTNARWWTDDDSFATTLLTLFLDRFGTAGLAWDPNTIVVEVEEAFNVALPQASLDKLMVGISLMTSDSFYKHLPTFIDFCNILSGDLFDPRTWDPADAGECAWGMVEALLIWPPSQDDDEPFTEEIRYYLGEVLDDEGIVNPPDILKIALRDGRGGADAYSDDPVMYSAIHDFEQSKTSEIITMIRGNLRKLKHQLDSLQLRTGDARGVVANLSQYAA